MALLIKKTGLLKSDGTEIPIGQGLNDGILIRFFPQGERKGFNQKLFLTYNVTLTSDLEDYSTIDVIYDLNNKATLINSFIVEIADFQTLINDYDQCVQELPVGTHPMAIVSYGYHKFIKEELEKVLGQNTIQIRLDLM
jgi:hypothetical protein